MDEGLGLWLVNKMQDDQRFVIFLTVLQACYILQGAELIEIFLPVPKVLTVLLVFPF